MHVVNSSSDLARSKRPQQQTRGRRPVSVNVDSSLSHLAKALFGSKHLSHIFRGGGASGGGLAGGGGGKRGEWDLSDSFIVNQIKTGSGASRNKLLFLDDSGLLDQADYEVMSVSSPFQAKSR